MAWFRSKRAEPAGRHRAVAPTGRLSLPEPAARVVAAPAAPPAPLPDLVPLPDMAPAGVVLGFRDGSTLSLPAGPSAQAGPFAELAGVLLEGFTRTGQGRAGVGR